MSAQTTTTATLVNRIGHQHEMVETWTVPSTSTAGTTYTVTAIANPAGLTHRCTCPGYVHHGHCKHGQTVEQAAEQGTATPKPSIVIGGLSARDVTIDDLWGRKSA